MFERAKHGAVDLIHGNEPLNGERVDDARSVMMECVASGQPKVVLDLSGVPLIDGAGLELLLEMQECCLERGGLLKLAGPSPLCRDILRATGVDRRFEIFENALAAAGSYAR